MAFVITPRGEVKRTYATTGTLSDTFTPIEDDIIVLQLAASSATSLSTVAGWGETFSEIFVFSSTDHHIHFWAARMPSSPGSGNIAVTHGSLTYGAIAYQISGASTTANLAIGGGGDLFVQSQTVSSYNPSSPLAVPALSAYASATNLSITANGITTNDNEFTAQSGWARANPTDTADTSNNFNTAMFYKASEDTSHTAEGTNLSYRYISGVGIEMQEAAAVGGGRIMSSLAGSGGLAHKGGIAGIGGGLAG